MFHVKQSNFFPAPLSAEQEKENIDIAGRDSRDARCLSDGSRGNPLQLLPGLGGKALDRGVIEIGTKLHILESSDFFSHHFLAVDIAAIFHENFGGLKNLLSALSLDILLHIVGKGRNVLNKVGKRKLRTKHEVHKFHTLLQRR